MVCTSCGSENKPTRRFCRSCGSPLVVMCPSCAAENDPDDRFCGACGAELGDRGGRERPSLALLPDQSERRFVTVLFADLVGFTRFSEGRDPESVRAALTAFYERAREIVTRFGGIIEKFIGDAVMAVWGATVAHEDDAERAVRAGFELVRAVGGLREALDERDLDVRVGVLSGDASVAPATPERGFIVGDLVNTTSRLQSLAEPGTVVVGDATYRMLQGVVEFEVVGERLLKGKSEPVEVWRARRALQGPQRAPVGWSEPGFVGREEELRLLRDALHATERVGRARLVSIVGEAGIGKTRLARELHKYVDGLAHDVYWHEGRSPTYDEGLTLWALGEMVRQRAGIAETDEPVLSRARLRSTVAEFVTSPVDRQWIEPRLAALLGLDEASTGERTEFFAAIRSFFHAIARRHPTVLVFEDFQSADADLIDFVGELVELSSHAPILVLTLARPDLLDRVPGWGAGHRHFTSAHLGPLTDDEMTRLVTGMVRGIDDEVVAAITERANGIPLYAVELIRMLVADGDLEMAEDACCRPARDLSSIRVPDTVRAIVGARLDRLAAATRALLQDAAVIGVVFTRAGVAAVSGVRGAQLDELLDELVHQDLIELESDPRSPERGQYRFVQSMIRDVAYDRLTPDERRARHVRAAEHFAGEHELVGAVASHITAAHSVTSDPDAARSLAAEATAALSSAADRASMLHSHAQGLAMIERALALTNDPAETAALYGRAARSASALAQHDRAIRYARQALEWYQGHGDGDEIAAAATLLAEDLCHAFRASDAISVLAPIVDAAPALDAPAVVTAAAQLARAYLMALRDEEAAAMGDRVLLPAERLDLVPTIVDALVTRGTALGNLGRMHEAISLLQGAARYAREHGLAVAEMRAANNLGHLLAFDDHVDAMHVCRTGLEQANRLGDVRFIGSFTSALASYLERDGRYDEAHAMRDDVRDRIELPAEARVWYEIADLTARVERGDTSAAAAAYDAVRRSSGDADPQSRAWLPAARARLHLLTGQLEAAYEEVMDEDAHRFPEHLVAATTAAALLGDLDRLRSVSLAIDSAATRGRLLTSMRATVAGAIAALEGRTGDAVTSFSQALRFRFLRIDRAREQALFAVLVGRRVPDGRSASDEAFGLFTSCGAAAFLDLYRAGLPSSPDGRVAAG